MSLPTSIASRRPMPCRHSSTSSRLWSHAPTPMPHQPAQYLLSNTSLSLRSASTPLQSLPTQTLQACLPQSSSSCRSSFAAPGQSTILLAVSPCLWQTSCLESLPLLQLSAPRSDSSALLRAKYHSVTWGGFEYQHCTSGVLPVSFFQSDSLICPFALTSPDLPLKFVLRLQKVVIAASSTEFIQD